jgi:hypothetical protein
MSDRLLTTAEVGLPMPQRIATVTLSESRQLARLGKLIPSDLAHPDTLPSVANLSEQAHDGRYAGNAPPLEKGLNAE